MSAYYSWPKLTPIPPLGVWRTLESIHVEDERGRILPIGPDTYSDLASVPNWAWPVLDCNANNLAMAGLTHDVACRRDAFLVVRATGDVLPVTFEDSLYFMNAVMVLDGISPSDRWKIISALKVGPDDYWHKKDLAWRPSR